MNGETLECPHCHGAGHVAAWITGASGSRFDPVMRCGTCKGGGRLSETVARWLTTGRVHYKARVARRESVMECSRRYGISPAELSGMEHGRLEPARLEPPNA